MHAPQHMFVHTYTVHMKPKISSGRKAEYHRQSEVRKRPSYTGHCFNSKARSLGLARLLATRWLEGDEADALHLAHVVETDDADIGVRVLLLDLLQLLDHL